MIPVAGHRRAALVYLFVLAGMTRFAPSQQAPEESLHGNLSTAREASQHLDPMAAQKRCRDLRGLTLTPSIIGLPTNGAYISRSSLTTSGGKSFCKVLGGIRPVDVSASDIHFEVNLPSEWNEKAVHYGGAVLDGSLDYSRGLKQPTLGPPHVMTPLQQGYVTLGSDSGHHKRYVLLPDYLNLFNASFAANDEELHNFSQDALKKTHDVAAAIISRHYGVSPRYWFFLGSSTGGHEALAVVQRWPKDYDGVMCGYPSWNGAELLLQFIRTAQALYAKGGFLPGRSTHLLQKTVLDACDALDGVKDGIVSDITSCHFDPSELLCSAKKRRGCLSRTQLRTVQTFASTQSTVQSLWRGIDGGS